MASKFVILIKTLLGRIKKAASSCEEAAGLAVTLKLDD